MAKKQKRNITKDGKMTIKIDPTKLPMTEDELQMHLHCKRKGSYIGKDKTKFNRKTKHKKRIAY